LNGPDARLFPSRDRREALEGELTLALARSRERISHGPVAPAVDLAAFRDELSAYDFQSPHVLGEVLPWIIAKMERGIVHVTHPRYFGLFNPAPTFPAQCADRIVATFNPQLASATTSPIPVEIEAHVIRAVARRAGFPVDAVGHFTTGGSEANCTALICALTRAHPKFTSAGVRAFPGAPVIYISSDSHVAWIKAAHQVGIGRSAARLIPADKSGRMSVEHLRAALHADTAAGNCPVMIVATAGTTAAGMIDPLAECGEIAREQGLWYHVDAAWGGALLASDKLRGELAGIERADSATIDAHKWFATTMGCGMFITRHPAVPSAAFNVSTSFMPSDAPSLDPYLTTLQWSRRFVGVRLFLALATVGWQGFAEHVERSIALAALLKRELVARGWRIANDSSLAVLCAEPPPALGMARPLVARVVASGRAWVSTASFDGREVMRACITNGETTEADVMALVDAVST
jgi:glutamate/tyrosine decarboxylase-like PLP-dependent enzyme